MRQDVKVWQQLQWGQILIASSYSKDMRLHYDCWPSTYCILYKGWYPTILWGYLCWQLLVKVLVLVAAS